MNTRLDSRAHWSATPDGEDHQVPFNRLTLVELRKLIDTRSGRWLLAAMSFLTAVVLVALLLAADPAALTYHNFVTATVTPQGILLPVLGILSITSEWGQRTGLITFALEPNRGKVVGAKLLAVTVLGATSVLVALGLAAVANLLGMALRQGDGSWLFGLTGVRDIAVLQLVSVMQGFALGLLITSSAGAIVVYFLLPLTWGVLSTVSEWFRTVGTWVDVTTTTQPLSTHQMEGELWVRLAVAVAIWVALPMTVGLLRLRHREFK